MLPSQFNYDLNAISLVKGTGSPPEIYIPLWWHSGSSAVVYNVTTQGSSFIVKGSATPTTSVSATQAKLHTLNSGWPSTTKFAFEVSLSGQSTPTTYYAALWDMTSNALINGSTVSISSTTATVLRSGQFTLTPGHVYGVTGWASAGGLNEYITDASLIVFPS